MTTGKIRRFLATLVLVWLLGFAWFALVLPQPIEAGRSDAVVVPTGSGGRIARGIEALDRKWARNMLVTGVDREVTANEFAAEYEVSQRQMKCCITLGYAAVDTRSNAEETAAWLKANKVGSIRLVTSDWHMRRAAWELRRVIPDDVPIARDAVPSNPSLKILFLEYNKLLVRRIGHVAGF